MWPIHQLKCPDCLCKLQWLKQLHAGYVEACWLPYLPLYHLNRCKGGMEILPEELWVPALYRQSLEGNLQCLSLCRPPFPRLCLTFLPQCNGMRRLGFRLFLQSYPAFEPAYNALKNAVPNEPWHHKPKRLRAGDNVPKRHRPQWHTYEFFRSCAGLLHSWRRGCGGEQA